MLLHRKVLAALSALIVIGSLSATLGYALHLRGDGYRRSLEDRLSELLGVKVSIGKVEPLSFSERRLNDVRATLPRRGVEVFGCEQALWAVESRKDAPPYAIELDRGRLLVGADAWDATDYGQLLRTGFGHDFTSLGIREIRLNNIDVLWRHGRFSITADDAGGTIRFDPDGTGVADLATMHLNGRDSPTPIQITARFTPGEQLRFHEVKLNVSSSPLPGLGLDELVGCAVTQGRFSGSVLYRDSDDGATVSVSGSLADARLRELTGPMPGGPYDGRVDVVVDEATFAGATLRTLRFNGGLTDLSFEQLAPIGGVSIGGRVSLLVHQGVIDRGAIKYFSAEGSAADVPLDALTTFIGQGRVTGTLRVNIQSLQIISDRLVAADITIDAVPPPDAPGVIDRKLLQTVSTRTLGFDATAMLPESMEGVEYRRLGVRLKLDGDDLRVMGTHGDDDKTILTVVLLGHDLAILKQPDQPIHVEDLLAEARKHLDRLSLQRLRGWLGDGNATPAPRRESNSTLEKP